MAAKTKLAVSAKVKAKAMDLLNFARKQARESKSPGELFIVIFGSQGKAWTLFPTEKERDAFYRTEQAAEIHKLIETFPVPVVTLRLPKSVHTSLLKEAAAEGVTLDNLCLAKLVAQLRELV
jgi:hypothetical protein